MPIPLLRRKAPAHSSADLIQLPITLKLLLRPHQHHQHKFMFHPLHSTIAAAVTTAPTHKTTVNKEQAKDIH